MGSVVSTLEKTSRKMSEGSFDDAMMARVVLFTWVITTCKIMGIGDIIITMFDAISCMISSVRHMPKLQQSLLSLKKTRRCL